MVEQQQTQQDKDKQPRFRGQDMRPFLRRRMIRLKNGQWAIVVEAGFRIVIRQKLAKYMYKQLKEAEEKQKKEEDILEEEK